MFIFVPLVLKLQPSNKTSIENNSNQSTAINDNVNLQIPLSNLYSSGHISLTSQLTFDDRFCTFEPNETLNPISIENDTNDDNDECKNTNILNNKLPCYHIYKYSRQERDLFYSRMKQRLIKKNSIPIMNKYRSKDFPPLLFNHTSYLINIPTKINSRQRIHSNKSQNDNIYPLIFSPNFNTLVKLSANPILKDYLTDIGIYFHLINSIATQEFQLIVHNYDNQHQFSFTSLSFLNILRQTVYDYTMNLQTSFKRNYFQTFHSENHDDDHDHESSMNHDNELSIPPLKIRRYDDSSYEIEKSSVSSKTTSSSSGMSITQIHNGHTQNYDDRRRCFEIRSRKVPMKLSDNQINSNFNDSEKKDTSELTVGSPLQCDLSIIDHQQPEK